MSVLVNYQRLSPATFEHLRSDAKAAASYFGDDLEDEDDDGWKAFLDARNAEGRFLSIRKNWHGLHFLLTGNADTVHFVPREPLDSVVVGGAPTEWEASYGVVQYLTSTEVQAISESLNTIDEEQLRSRFDVASFQINDIYPKGDEWLDTDVEALVETFHRVEDFMNAAVRDGEMVLISFS